MNRPRAAGPGSVWPAALTGLVIVLVIVARLLSVVGWEPAAFLAFGEDFREITTLAESELGRDVPVRVSQGHDGKFFFVQALDPLYLEPSLAEQYLDRPVYRAQRMLYPLLGSGFGLFPADWLPWSLLLLNIMAVAFGTVATAAVARSMGGSPWWGLAFALNPGVLSELVVGGAGVIAFAFAMAGIAAVLKSRWWPATALFAASALSREALLLFIFGAAILVWRREDKGVALRIGLIPLAIVAAWAAYLRLQLSGGGPVPEVQEFGLPFRGIVEASSAWLDSPVDLLGAFVVLASAWLVVRKSITRPTYVGWGASGFALLAVVLSRQVWLRYFDISRAVVPLLTAYLLVAFAGTRSESEPRAPGR